MGASAFSGFFDKNPDIFDGEGRITRDNTTNSTPSMYGFLKQLALRQIPYQKEAADGAAATATAEQPFYVTDTYIKSIQSIKFLPAAGLTADNTNFATLIVRARKADGTLIGIVGQLVTNVAGGSWTAFVAKTVPLTNGTVALGLDNAALDLPAGAMLSFEITKTAAGVVVPAGQLVVAVK